MTPKQPIIKLEATVHAREYLDYLTHSKSKKVFISKVLTVLKQYFGSPILLKIPAPLDRIPIPLTKAIKLTNKLKVLGVVEKVYTPLVREYPDEPFLFNCYIKPHGYGSDFFAVNKAYERALGEALERKLWLESDTFYKDKSVKNSYDNLQKQAYEVLDIFSLAGFSQDQIAENKILQFNEKTTFQWTSIYSLTKREKVLCPTQLMSVKYIKEMGEPLLRWSVSTGLATGRSLAEALVNGMLEIIERDAFMITYLNKLSPPILDLQALAQKDPEISFIQNSLKRYLLDIYVIELPTDFPVHASLAVCVDTTTHKPMVSLGACANFSKKTTIIKSVREAIAARYAVRNMLKMEHRAILKTEELDRDGRLMYWAQKENLKDIDFLLKGEKKHVDTKKQYLEREYNKKECKKDMEFLVKTCREKKYDALYIELTTKEIRKKTGLYSVFTIIPQLQPLHLEERIPYFGGKRLESVPVQLGYKAQKELNTEPHLFH